MKRNALKAQSTRREFFESIGRAVGFGVLGGLTLALGVRDRLLSAHRNKNSFAGGDRCSNDCSICRVAFLCGDRSDAAGRDK